MKKLSALCLALLGCSSSSVTPPPSDGGADTDAPATVEWTPVVEKLDGALLSIWGTGANEAFAVGGSLGNGLRALVLRFDGAKWKRLDPGHTDTYWWVHGTSATDVWMVGEKGRISHFDGASLKDYPGVTTATLFGVWASSPNDAWAVGGSFENPGLPNDVVLHWDGASWKPEALPQKLDRTHFKVWGASADDVYVVGDLGTVWHKKSGTWKREAEGVATERILTVTGCSPTEIYAVGGRTILRSAGDGQWAKVTDVALVSDVNGVACAPSAAPNGKVLVVGGGSLKLRQVDGKLVSDFGSKPFTDLHGAWIDPTGAMWGVGGNFLGSARPGATRDGVIARYGAGVVSGVVE